MEGTLGARVDDAKGRAVGGCNVLFVPRTYRSQMPH